MTDLVARTMRTLAAGWKREAELRKMRTPADQAADAIASCASELEAMLADVEAQTVTLTVAQWAKAHDAAESSVRRWCESGQLPGAVKDAKGDWQIPRDAVRTVRHQRATG